MRRRIRSAAFPVHRHAIPQVALDAGLVALSYFLAYRLRFDGGVPVRYEDLFDRTITFAICGSVFTFMRGVTVPVPLTTGQPSSVQVTGAR